MLNAFAALILSSFPNSASRITSPNGIRRSKRGGFKRRRHSVGRVRVEEGGVFGADRNVALVQPIERAAGEQAVDGEDERLPDPVLLGTQPKAGIVFAQRVGVAEPALLAVDAGREGLVSPPPAAPSA